MIVRVATSVAENLRGHPLALALVVINVMFLCAGLWFMLQVSNATSEERTARHEMMEQLVKYCLDQKRKGREAREGSVQTIGWVAATSEPASPRVPNPDFPDGMDLDPS